MYIDVKIEELYPEHQHSWPHLEDPASSFLSPECPAADCRHREQISGDLTGGSLPSCRALGPTVLRTHSQGRGFTQILRPRNIMDILLIYGAYLKVF